MISRRSYPKGLALAAIAAAAIVAILLGSSAPSVAADSRIELAVQPTWTIPSPEEINKQIAAWLSAVHASDDARRRVDALWARPASASDELLDRLAATFAVVDPEAQKAVDFCSKPRAKGPLPSFEALKSAGALPLERDHLRLYYGRFLAREKLYDEAREQLAGLEIKNMLDPATLLFYRSVIHHSMLEQEPGLESVGHLLERSTEIPRRYAALGQLMQADLEALQDESLDHISRRMNDVERRLDLGHAGPKVRGVEDGVIASLDKMIKQIEQQEQQNSSASQQKQAGGESRPASESRLLEGKGPGKVANRDIGQKSGWGNLPPRQRQEALQQIGKEFPAHYREVVEQYFRKLAGQDGEDQSN